MEWQYFSGDCSSPAAQQQAKENFVQGVKEVIGNGDPKFCETTQVCDLESIRVICGKTSSRKRSLGYSVSYSKMIYATSKNGFIGGGGKQEIAFLEIMFNECHWEHAPTTSSGFVLKSLR